MPTASRDDIANIARSLARPASKRSALRFIGDVSDVMPTR